MHLLPPILSLFTSGRTLLLPALYPHQIATDRNKHPFVLLLPRKTNTAVSASPALCALQPGCPGSSCTAFSVISQCPSSTREHGLPSIGQRGGILFLILPATLLLRQPRQWFATRARWWLLFILFTMTLSLPYIAKSGIQCNVCHQQEGKSNCSFQNTCCFSS